MLKETEWSYMRDDRTLVIDIIEQCNWIEDHIRFYGEDVEIFMNNKRYQDNVILSRMFRRGCE